MPNGNGGSKMNVKTLALVVGIGATSLGAVAYLVQGHDAALSADARSTENKDAINETAGHVKTVAELLAETKDGLKDLRTEQRRIGQESAATKAKVDILDRDR